MHVQMTRRRLLAAAAALPATSIPVSPELPPRAEPRAFALPPDERPKRPAEAVRDEIDRILAWLDQRREAV